MSENKPKQTKTKALPSQLPAHKLSSSSHENHSGPNSRPWTPCYVSMPLKTPLCSPYSPARSSSFHFATSILTPIDRQLRDSFFACELCIFSSLHLAIVQPFFVIPLRHSLVLNPIIFALSSKHDGLSELQSWSTYKTFLYYNTTSEQHTIPL